MKCVKNIVKKEILRKRDGEAAMLVASGDWIYVPKSEWKEKVRDSKVNN
tara:strand:- start:4272 stop:4418 length:147 start_codon:yes stop_codon:yes gene_type:complete